MKEFTLGGLKSELILKFNDPFSGSDQAVIKIYPENEDSYFKVLSSGALSLFGVKYEDIEPKLIKYKRS